MITKYVVEFKNNNNNNQPHHLRLLLIKQQQQRFIIIINIILKKYGINSNHNNKMKIVNNLQPPLPSTKNTHKHTFF